MKRLLFSLLLASISLLTAEARHIIGGSMDYYYKGDSLFIRMTLYRDCSGGGAPFDEIAFIGVYQNSTLYATIPGENPVTEALEPVYLPAGCTIPMNPAVCVEKAVYEFPVFLPAEDSLNTYTVVYQRCCHAQTITNLLDPGAAGSTFSVQLAPPARRLKNNAPVFPVAIPVVACVHQPVAISWAASNPDGDVLSYKLCAPLAGGGPILTAPGLSECNGATPNPPCAPPYNTTAFATPTYSSDNPFDAENLSLSAQTGLLQFIPHTLGQFTYAVCVEERRNGQLLGTVMQEILLYVVDGTVPAVETSALQPLEISPNPASAEITVGMKNFDGELVEITMSDVTGKTVFFQKKRVSATEVLTINQLSTGTYTIRVSSERSSASGFFVRL